MSLSAKAIQEFKDIIEEKTGDKLTDQEAQKQAENLVQLTQLMYEVALKETIRKQRLKKEPDGFALKPEDGSYNCRVCYRTVSGPKAWWDEWGVKCLDCQRNIKQGVIPAKICKDDELALKNWQLRKYFNLHPATAGKMKREGKLKATDLKNKDGNIYTTLYLVNENRKLFKKLKDGKRKSIESQ